MSSKTFARLPRPALISQLALPLVEELARLDPPPDTPEGKLLVALAAALEEYEKERFPGVGSDDHD